MNVLRLTAVGAWRSSLEQWSWRSFMITLILNQAIGPLVGLLVWTAVEPTSQPVRVYFFILLAVQLLTVSYEDHTLCASIFDGTITNRLMLPQPVIVDFAGTNLALRFWHTLFGLPILAIVGVAVGVHVHPLYLLIAVPAVVIAGALRFVFTITLAMSAFWTQRATALVALGNTVIALLGGLAAPLFLLPGHLSSIGRLLPIWPMLGMPAEIAAGTLSAHQVVTAYITAVIWLVLLTAAAALVWRRGLHAFTAVGA